VAAQQCFPRGLYGGNAARFGFGQFHEAAGAALSVRSNIKVIAHQMQERRILYELASRIQSMAIAERLFLLHELNGGICRGVAIRFPIAGRNDDANFGYARAVYFFENDTENRFFNSVPVDQHLKGQRTLVTPRCGDNRSMDSHFDGTADTAYRPTRLLPIL